MSMLTRKGTMVRKNRGSHSRGQSVKRTHSSGSTSRKIPTDSTEIEEGETPTSAKSPSGKIQAPTIVCYDDEKNLCKTEIDWSRSRGSIQSNYGAVFIQIKEADKEAEGSCDFMCRAGGILCNTAFVTVFLGLATVLPIGMMSIGVKYLNECPRQPKIPVYLLVGGCFGMLKLLCTVWRQIQQRRYDSVDLVFDASDGEEVLSSRSYRMMDSLLTLFLFAWLVTGTYWSFEIWKPNFQQILHEPNNWCHKTVYVFAVCQIIGCYAALVLSLFVFCSLAAVYRFRSYTRSTVK